MRAASKTNRRLFRLCRALRQVDTAHEIGLFFLEFTLRCKVRERFFAMTTTRRVPRDLRIAPALDARVRDVPVRSHFALLINPFYPKDPHASFGKHVLTPSLALTSIAGATPAPWAVRYWDENLLQGPAPWRP